MAEEIVVNRDEILKEGWLVKQSVHMKTWRKRWVVLTPQYLCAFKSQPVSEAIRILRNPTEAIRVRDCKTVKSADEQTGKGNSFSVDTPGRVFYLIADASADKEAWICHIADAQLARTLSPSNGGRPTVLTEDQSECSFTLPLGSPMSCNSLSEGSCFSFSEGPRALARARAETRVSLLTASSQRLWLDLTSRKSWISSSGLPRLDVVGNLWADVRDIGNELWWACWSTLDAVRCDKWMLLMACIIVDLIGMASYAILLLGEVVDLWWAPVCGLFLQYMFGSMLMTSFGAIEEFLPFTDIIPTATLCWVISQCDSLECVQKILGMQRHAAADDSAAMGFCDSPARSAAPTIMLAYGGDEGSFDNPREWFGSKKRFLSTQVEVPLDIVFHDMLPETYSMKAAVAMPFPVPQFKRDGTGSVQAKNSEQEEIARLDIVHRSLGVSAPSEPLKVTTTRGLMRPNPTVTSFKSQGEEYYLYGPFRSSVQLMKAMAADPMLQLVHDEWSKREFSALEEAFQYGALYLRIRWEGWFVTPVLEMNSDQLAKLFTKARDQLPN